MTEAASIAAVLAYLRSQPVPTTLPENLKPTDAMSDDDLARLMFYTVRRTTPTQIGNSHITNVGNNSLSALNFSKRLTKKGLQILSAYVKPYPIAVPQGEIITLAYLRFLSANTTLPFFASSEQGYVVFDSLLAVRLKLADGQISILIAIES